MWLLQVDSSVERERSYGVSGDHEQMVRHQSEKCHFLEHYAYLWSH